MDKCLEFIEKFLATKVKIIENITGTNNTVIKIEANGNIYYLKIYNNNAIHIDNEIMLYQTLPKESLKFFKELVCSNSIDSEKKKFALFKEIKGETLSDLLEQNKINDDLANKISLKLIEYFKLLKNNIKTQKFGNLNDRLEGNYENFLKYLYEYQFPTTTTLFLNEKTRHLSYIPFKLLAENAVILNDNKSSVTPIDSNFKNIIVTKEEEIKIIDPGSIISAPIYMGLGELVAHSYGTIIYDKLVKNLDLKKSDIKKLSIYAILSLLNIMAFLVRNNIGEIEKSKPFGNKFTFFQLIDKHLEIINS